MMDNAVELVIGPDRVIAWLEQCRDFPGATPEGRQLAAAALERLLNPPQPAAIPATVEQPFAERVVSRERAEAFLDVLVGRSYGDQGAYDNSPHVMTHLRAVLGLQCLPDNLAPLYPWDAENLARAERLVDYLTGAVAELRKALDEHKATKYPGPASANEPDIPF